LPSPDLTREIIGAAIKIHRELGPGLLESAYEACLAYELHKLGLKVERQKPVPLIYEQVKLECGFRADLVVEGRVVVETKCKDGLHPVDEAQLLSHLRLLNIFRWTVDQLPRCVPQDWHQAHGQQLS
jgi:GxxExxY protein